MPDQKELASRLHKDGNVDRLREINQNSQEDLPEVKVEAGQSDLQRLREWLSTTGNDKPEVLEQIKRVCAATDSPAELGKALIASGSQLDGKAFDWCLEALARRALGMEQPEDAGFLLTQLNHRAPTWDRTMRAVQAWRWAVRPDEALKTLDLAIADGLKEQDCPESSSALRLKLALESNQPNLAFDIVLMQYRTAVGADRITLLHRLVELANAGDRTTEAYPVVADYLTTIPFQTSTLDQAVEMVRNGKAFASSGDEASYREYATLLARWQEWAGHGDQAVETWFHLALLGSDEAWGRSQELYDDVLRQEDFAKLLSFRISRGLDEDKVLMLAGLLVDAGHVDEAIVQYQAALARHVDPLLVHRALARIYAQMGRWQASIDEFAEVLNEQPSDVEAGKGRAFALVRLRRYDEAGSIYVELARAQPGDAELQETCAGLCDSLGRNEEAREAARRLLACKNRLTTPEDHLDLADQCRFAGDAEGAVAALREGFGRCPGSLRLRMSLAGALATKGEHDEAVQLLAHESLRANPEAMDLLINEAMDASNASVAAAFLGTTVPDCLETLAVSRLKMAFLFDHLNRTDDADAIVAGLLHDPRFRQGDTWMSLGRMCLDKGDSDRAEAFATLYLSSSGAGNSKAWELLGDIYQSEDRNLDALAAYRNGVEVIRMPAGTPGPPAQSPLKVSQRTTPSLPASP